MSVWDGNTNQPPFIGDQKSHHPGAPSSETSSHRGRTQSLNIENFKSRKYDTSWLASEKQLKQPPDDKLSLKSMSSTRRNNIEPVNKNYLERFGNYFMAKNKKAIVGRSHDLNLDKSSSSSSSASTTTSSIGQNHDGSVMVMPNNTNNVSISSSSKSLTENSRRNSISENNVSSDTSKKLVCDNLIVKEALEVEHHHQLHQHKQKVDIVATASTVTAGGGGSSSNSAAPVVGRLNRDEVNSFLLPRIIIKNNG